MTSHDRGIILDVLSTSVQRRTLECEENSIRMGQVRSPVEQKSELNKPYFPCSGLAQLGARSGGVVSSEKT